MITNLIQLLVSGVAMGAIYTLSAMGLFVTHLATNRLNFGQGEFLMVSAFLSMSLLLAGVSTVLVFPLVLLASGLMGWALERFFVRPLDRFEARGTSYAWILTTAGVALILQNVVELIWGNSTQYSPPLFSSAEDNVVALFGVGFFIEEIALVAIAVAVIALFYIFLLRSRWGDEIYAVAFEPDTARLLGINVKRVVVMVFVAASMLAGISGILVGPIISVHPHMGLIFTVKALAVVVIGGFGNPIGILIAGFAFGITEAFSNYFDSAFGDLYPLIFVLVFLVLRPDGLYREKRTDVR